jgi:Sulfotransferase family
MSNLVFITGDFCSGSTLLFTLFRKTGQYYCLYEPLHEDLLEYLIWPLQVYEHHFFVDNYFAELRRFHAVWQLFNRDWGIRRMHLEPTAPADDLYRYLSYVIGSAFGRSSQVLVKENRLTFRLGWLRANFPRAKIIHIYRDKEKQWNSMVRRVQATYGREEVGQHEPSFPGFNMAGWCEDLKSKYPQLDAARSKTGYERFCKLWELSFLENQRYSDLSVDYADLCADFTRTFTRICNCLGRSFDMESLERYIVAPDRQRQVLACSFRRGRPLSDLINRVGRKYARIRLAVRELFRRAPASRDRSVSGPH